MDMTFQLDFQDSDIPDKNPLEQSGDALAPQPPPTDVKPQQVIGVRRKRRRRSLAPSSSGYSNPPPAPIYIPPTVKPDSGTRRRRSRQRKNRGNNRRIWRLVIYVTIHIVFIALLVFLWLKISAKIAE
jgi:hypothetical protein